MPVRALAEPRGRVRLRVEVDDERALAGLREAGGEVDRGRRLADAALLVREGVDPIPGTRSRLLRPSGRFLATPGRRGKPGGVGPRFSSTSEAGRALDELARRAARRPGRPARRSALGPDARGSPRRPADERQAPLRGDRRRRERLRQRDAEAVRAPAPRRGPTRPSRSAAPSARRKSHLRRFASSSVTCALRAARPRAGSRASRRPSRRRPPGRRSARRAAPPAARRRAAPRRASAGSRDRRQPRRRRATRGEPVVEHYGEGATTT